MRERDTPRSEWEADLARVEMTGQDQIEGSGGNPVDDSREVAKQEPKRRVGAREGVGR
jgi:hypothetical protein